MKELSKPYRYKPNKINAEYFIDKNSDTRKPFWKTLILFLSFIVVSTVLIFFCNLTSIKLISIMQIVVSIVGIILKYKYENYYWRCAGFVCFNNIFELLMLALLSLSWEDKELIVFLIVQAVAYCIIMIIHHCIVQRKLAKGTYYKKTKGEGFGLEVIVPISISGSIFAIGSILKQLNVSVLFYVLLGVIFQVRMSIAVVDIYLSGKYSHRLYLFNKRVHAPRPISAAGSTYKVAVKTDEEWYVEKHGDFFQEEIEREDEELDHSCEVSTEFSRGLESLEPNPDVQLSPLSKLVAKVIAINEKQIKMGDNESTDTNKKMIKKLIEDYPIPTDVDDIIELLIVADVNISDSDNRKKSLDYEVHSYWKKKRDEVYTISKAIIKDEKAFARIEDIYRNSDAVRFARLCWNILDIVMAIVFVVGVIFSYKLAIVAVAVELVFRVPYFISKWKRHKGLKEYLRERVGK